MNGTLLAVGAGFGTGISLIVAIGAQNAFVLRHGIRGESVLPIVVLCTASDAVLMAVGISGIGAVFGRWPAALTIVGSAGGGFLVCYGLLAARRSLRPGRLDAATAVVSPRRAVWTCAALTWLNPHVYLDTVLLLGSIATGYGTGRWSFGVGAVIASACWFSAIGFGARLLRGFFARPASWRVLDGCVAATMLTLGATMIVRL